MPVLIGTSVYTS